MYYQLGDIKYENAVGFQSLDQVEEESWVEHAVIDGKPVLQKTGSKLDTVEIAMRFHRSFTDPDLELNKLRAHRKKGSILALIRGDGTILGNFVIKSMNIGTKGQINGTIIYYEVQVSLLEFASADIDATAKTQAVNNGFANSQNTPLPSTPSDLPTTPTMEAADSLISGNANINAAGGLSEILDANSTLLKTTCEQLQTKVNKALFDISKMVTLIDADSSSELWDNTRDLSTSAQVLITKLTDLAGDVAQLISDIDSNPGAVAAGIITVTEDVTDALDQLDQVQTDASKMAAMVALKK